MRIGDTGPVPSTRQPGASAQQPVYIVSAMTTTGGAVRPRALTGKPPRVIKHPWRVAIVVGVLLVVANLFVFLLSQSDTKREGRSFPVGIDTVSPRPGELIRPQDTITADLRADLTGDLVLDGQRIPADQLDRVTALGEVSFRPGNDKDLDELAPGAHSVAVLFWEQGKPEPENPKSYSWSFRVGA